MTSLTRRSDPAGAGGAPRRATKGQPCGNTRVAALAAGSVTGPHVGLSEGGGRAEHRVPLSVLDLVPVPSGATPAEAVKTRIDLARRAEALGYGRYWFAKHHLNPGVAGTTPAVMIGLVAAATRSIRVGSAGVQLGHRTPLSVVDEEFGLLDCAYPGRLDLGLGRTRGTPRRPASASTPAPARGEAASPAPAKPNKRSESAATGPGASPPPRSRPGRTGSGIL